MPGLRQFPTAGRIEHDIDVVAYGTPHTAHQIASLIHAVRVWGWTVRSGTELDSGETFSNTQLRLLREIVTSHKVTGDVTTLEDMSVVQRLASQQDED